jgi:hypothetical protein
MLVYRFVQPAFFRGETLPRAVYPAAGQQPPRPVEPVDP